MHKCLKTIFDQYLLDFDFLLSLIDDTVVNDKSYDQLFFPYCDHNIKMENGSLYSDRNRFDNEQYNFCLLDSDFTKSYSNVKWLNMNVDRTIELRRLK